MATAYGSYDTSAGYNAYRAVLDYSSSSTNTQVTISTTGKVQSGYGHDSMENFALSLTIGDSTTAKTSSEYLSEGATVTFGTKSRTYNRTHSAQTITVKAYAKNDGTYTGWTGSSTASATVSVPALPSYSVTFNANGGSGAPAAQTKWYGETLTISATKPTRSGYIFKGWATSASATTATYQPGASYTTNAALSLYAVWQQGTYTIAYAANGGSSTPASQTKTHGVALTLRPAISRANGTTSYTVSYSANYSGGTNPSSGTATKTTKYTFAGWKATNGTVYAGGASYTTDAATTMTAQWTSSSSTTSVTLPTPTRTGYTFQGWWTASTGGTKVGNGGATYTPSASITLYAHWSIIVYTVSYNANGGSGAPASQSKNHGTSITLSSTQPTRSGYTFLGWSTNSTGTGTAYAPGGTYSTNASATLYAVWAGVQVTSLTAYRSNSSGTRSDSGTYGYIAAGYKAIGTIAGTVTLTATANGVDVSSQLSNRSGSKTATADYSATATGAVGGSYSESTAVNVLATATLSVTYGGSTRTVTAQRIATIPKVFRLLDALAGGTGLAIGTVATLASTLEVGITSLLNGVVNVMQGNLTRAGQNDAAANGDHPIQFIDSAKLVMSYIDAHKTNSSPNNYLRLTAIGPSGSKTGNLYISASDSAGYIGTDCLWNTSLTTDTTAHIVRDSRFDRDGSNPSSSVWSAIHGFQDKDGENLGYLQAYQLTNGATGLNLWVIAEGTDGTEYNNYIRLAVDKSGTKAYSVGDAAAFRSAIGAQVAGSYQPAGSYATTNCGGYINALASVNIQQWYIHGKVNNSSNTARHNHDTWLVMNNSGPSCWDATTSETIWQALTNNQGLSSATGTANTQLNALTWRWFTIGGMLIAFAHGTTKTLAISTAVGSSYYQSGGITIPIPSTVGFTAAPYGVITQFGYGITSGPSTKNSWSKTQVIVDAMCGITRTGSGYEINLVVWGV